MHVNYVQLTFHVIVYKKHFLNRMVFVKHLLDVTV